MSTANRKQRKLLGQKFYRAQKIGTPVLERAFFNEYVSGGQGDRLPRRRAIGQRIRKAFELGWLPADNHEAAEITV